MRTETIEWHVLPMDGMPDACLTVLISTEHAGVNSGWFDGEHWRWCESGGIVGEPVQGWASIPHGIVPLPAFRASRGKLPSGATVRDRIEYAIAAIEHGHGDWALTVLRPALRPAPAVGAEGFALVQSPITEEMHRAACKVLVRASGLDGTPQRMLDALAALSQPPVQGSDQ